MNTTADNNPIAAQDGSAITNMLESIWADMVAEFPELPERVLFITGVGSTQRGVTRGHWRQEGWRTEGNGNLPEMFISGERLADGGYGVVCTMLHEAVHALARVRNIQDTSRQGRWHNKRFVTIANEVGLRTPEQPDPSIGFSSTELTEETRAKWDRQIKMVDASVQAHIPNHWAEFETGVALVLGLMTIWGWDIHGARGQAARTNQPSIPIEKPRPKKRTQKMVCACSTITLPIKQAASFNATCNECGDTFVREEDEAAAIAGAGEAF